MRRLKGCGMTKLREVASGSATGSLAEKQKSDISGKQRDDFLGEEQLGKLGEEEDEEGEPAIERRR